MLKIREDVDLNVLEKYGFEENGFYYSRTLKHLDRMKVIGNVWDKNDC